METTGQFESFVVRLRTFMEVALKECAANATPGDSARPRGQALSAKARSLLCPDLERKFGELALQLFRLQFAHNSPYRRFCQTRNVHPQRVERWTEIPAAPTSAFKEVELSCLPASDRSAVFYSSGTTGQQPSRHFHHALSLAVYEESLWPWFRAHLLPEGGPLAPRQFDLLGLAPRRGVAPHSSLVYMFDVIRKRLGLGSMVFAGTVLENGAWGLDLEKAIRALKNAEARGRKLVVLGAAFSFVHLLDELVARGLKIALPPGSRVMETGGYKGRSRSIPKTDLHAWLCDRLGISSGQIVCEYGMSELSSQAYDHRASQATQQVSRAVNSASGPERAFVFPPWARAQVISPETGREVPEGGTGLIRVFDLANVCSVMAIQTEDLAVRRGDGFDLVGRAALAEPRGCSLMAL